MYGEVTRLVPLDHFPYPKLQGWGSGPNTEDLDATICENHGHVKAEDDQKLLRADLLHDTWELLFERKNWDAVCKLRGSSFGDYWGTHSWKKLSVKPQC